MRYRIDELSHASCWRGRGGQNPGQLGLGFSSLELTGEKGYLNLILKHTTSVRPSSDANYLTPYLPARPLSPRYGPLRAVTVLAPAPVPAAPLASAPHNPLRLPHRSTAPPPPRGSTVPTKSAIIHSYSHPRPRAQVRPTFGASGG